MVNRWLDLKPQLEADPGNWSFWIQFYDDVLVGRDQKWPMLHDIATSAAIDCDAPAANINAAIEAVRIKFLIAATPNAEVMSLNPVTGLLRVDPFSGMPKDHLSDAVAQLNNVLDLFDFDTVTGNQYLPIEAEWRIIHQAVDAYADRPRMLYSACQRTIRRLEVKFANGVCPSPDEDADISDLYETVTRVSVDLLERDSQIKEVVTARSAGKLAKITKDMVEVLQNGALELSQISEGALANELPRLADALTDAGADADEKAETLYILGSRFLRGWVLSGYAIWGKAKTGLTELKTATWLVSGIANDLGDISVQFAKFGGVSAALTSPIWFETVIKILTQLF